MADTSFKNVRSTSGNVMDGAKRSNRAMIATACARRGMSDVEM